MGIHVVGQNQPRQFKDSQFTHFNPQTVNLRYMGRKRQFRDFGYAYESQQLIERARNQKGYQIDMTQRKANYHERRREES